MRDVSIVIVYLHVVKVVYLLAFVVRSSFEELLIIINLRVILLLNEQDVVLPIILVQVL